ncbi:hemagglutinin/amebocyte aggregation factor [Elysia marginata]|uniref:Hemagglutinin/amebocyte aggregation factor n=1 Tax=Elysia marginata TaxID=1093978 RepID=A0AAV4FJI9_9GAST|nr:hemagglutinin/amebocyte aggregation factor [Elysia marginata]
MRDAFPSCIAVLHTFGLSLDLYAIKDMSLKLVAVLTLLVVCAVFAEDVEYDNEFAKNLNFECPQDQVITSVYSAFDGFAVDRRFKFGCSPTPGNAKPRKCVWTDGFVNKVESAMAFMCPANHLIAGVASVYDNVSSDRRMKIKCCRRPGFRTNSCYFTDYLNNWTDPLDYTIAGNKVLTGWLSVHDNGQQDRRNRMVECQYGPNMHKRSS